MKHEIAILTMALALAAGASAYADIGRHPGRIHHHRATHRYAGRAIRHWSVEMRGDGATDPRAFAASKPSDHRLRPALETRIGQIGATASVGFNPGHRALDPDQLNGAAATRLGKDGGSAGVGFKIPL